MSEVNFLTFRYWNTRKNSPNIINITADIALQFPQDSLKVRIKKTRHNTVDYTY